MRLVITALLILGGTAAHAIHTEMPELKHEFVYNSFDRASFYAAMESDNLTNVNAQLKLLDNATLKEKDAFRGALLMKKAGLVAGPAKKLKIFKEGHQKLEAALSKDSDNVEYRFLRLMIQENAPKILNYNKELDIDSEFISKHFAETSSVVQKSISSYSKRSKVLKPIQL